LSMYLGYLGYKTANVPIVKGIKPPKELFEIDSAKIVGLTIEAERLAEIRQERARRLGGSSHRNYTALMAIYEELDEAAAIQRKPACTVMDTTGLSTEETASRVIRLVEHRLHDEQKAKAKARGSPSRLCPAGAGPSGTSASAWPSRCSTCCSRRSGSGCA